MLTAERLRELLDYDPLTGEFRWRAATNRHICIGAVAGRVEKIGYRRIGIDGAIYAAHRLAFLYITGEMPKQVDHINGIGMDNRWSNLRQASQIASNNMFKR